MPNIKVLVVDDSVVAREIIIDILSADKEIIIAGEAVNGLDAIQKVKKIKPDIITMDINMPVMDGMEAIEEIMAFNAVPILVVTSRGDAATAYTAISKGALEVLQKPDIDSKNPKEFIKNVKLLSKVKVIPHIKGKSKKFSKGYVDKEFKKSDLPEKIVVIASSIGGPKALSVVLSALPENFSSPIVIAQHIPPDFVTGMVEWLNSISRLNVKIGNSDDPLVKGNVYVVSPECNTLISDSKKIKLAYANDEDKNIPSCDMLLTSAAKVYGSNCIGLIMTGMGRDGMEGIANIKEAGGKTLAQDETSSIVFGMAKLAIDKGYIDYILPLNEIAGKLNELVNVES